MQAITLRVPPQAWQVSTSMLNTRLRRCAQVIAMDGMYAGFAGAKTGHGGTALGRCLIICLFRFRRLRLTAFTPPCRSNQCPVFAVKSPPTL